MWKKEPLQVCISVFHEIRQEDESHPVGQEGQDRSFDMETVKYVNLDSMKLVIFTKLESSIIQRRIQITYRIDSGADGSLMTFKILKVCSPDEQQKHCMSQK